MKRISVILAAAAVLGMLISAPLFASGQQDSGEMKKEVTEIVYWQYFYETKKDTVDTLISMFEEENPDIKVIHQTFPYEQYNTKVASSVPSGEGPNVINLYYGWLPTYIDSGYLQALPDSTFSNEVIEDEFFSLVSAAKFDGSYYALPTAVRSLALFWNKDLFEKAGLDPEDPPETVDELVEYAKKLTETDKNGNYLQTGLTMELRAQMHHWLREVLIRQYGGAPYNADGTQVMYNNQAGYDAFEFFVDLNRKENIGMPNFMTDDVTAFKSGMMGMTIDGSFRLGTLDPIESLNYGVTELPAMNGERYNFASFWANGITSFTSGKELEASVKFLDFLTSDTAMSMWLENVGELPAKQALAMTDEFKNDPKYGPFIRGLEYANATKFIDESAQRMVWIDAYDQVLLNDMSIQDAVDQAAETEQQVLDKYYTNR
ncbi:MAG: extracellular solute-binding protein [Spirochaetia bacterium]|nr:extracellular solute-binding protein [Spirochaetia bacterium]MCF7946796.1 extracellular solute-binding protein [Spirochaetia bacterium]MCF7952686.1 extracellular solute-binding protein [Spirochaetales bacterium]